MLMVIEEPVFLHQIVYLLGHIDIPFRTVGELEHIVRILGNHQLPGTVIEGIYNIVAAQKAVTVIHSHGSVPVQIHIAGIGIFPQQIYGPFSFFHSGVQIRQIVVGSQLLIEGNGSGGVLIIDIDGGSHSRQVPADGHGLHRISVPPGLCKVDVGDIHQIGQIPSDTKLIHVQQNGIHHIIGVVPGLYCRVYILVEGMDASVFQHNFHIVVFFHICIPVEHSIVDGFPGQRFGI